MKLREFIVLTLIIAFLVLVSLAIGMSADQKSGTSSGEKCAECHGDSVEFKEWKMSKHSESLKTIQKNPKASMQCIKCHSADYISYSVAAGWGRIITPPNPQTAKDPVSCSSCHRHGSGIEHNLIMPVEKLCVSCHKFDCG